MEVPSRLSISITRNPTNLHPKKYVSYNPKKTTEIYDDLKKSKKWNIDHIWIKLASQWNIGMNDPLGNFLLEIVSEYLHLSIYSAESWKHYGRTVIDRRKVCRKIEIWRKVLLKTFF